MKFNLISKYTNLIGVPIELVEIQLKADVPKRKTDFNSNKSRSRPHYLQKQRLSTTNDKLKNNHDNSIISNIYSKNKQSAAK